MVLKRSNCELNSGNTLRKRVYNGKVKAPTSAEHWIIKYYLNRIIQPVDFERQNAAILDQWSEYVDDGDLETVFNFHQQLVFSMNKHKRWLFPDVLRNTIIEDDDLPNEHFKVTLCEHSLENTGYCQLGTSYCVGYADSSNHMKYVKPNKPRSYITDLREKGKACEPKPKASRRRRFHNQHKRGLQRPAVSTRHENNSQTNVTNQPERIPEVRYEVTTPSKFSSNRHHVRGLMGSKWIYWHYDPRKKSIRKAKGFRNKPDNGERFWRYNRIDMKIDTELETRYPGGEEVDEQNLWTFSEEIHERQTTRVVQLEDLVVKRSPRKNHRRKSLDSSCEGSETYVFYDPETEMKLNVKVEQISRASSHWTKKYRKDSAVYEKEKDMEDTVEDDFEIVDHDIPSATMNQISEAVMEKLRIDINTFNEDFCVCKIFMVDIMPRKLVETLGSSVQVGMTHPYTIVLDLDKCSLVIQLSQGLGMWPDPESQNVVNIRLTLQGPNSRLLLTANNNLQDVLLNDPKRVFTIKSLHDCVQDIVLGITHDQHVSRSDPRPRKSRVQQMFEDLVHVKTARQVREEFHQAQGVLPSTARMDVFNLIEFDLGLVEECSVCFASWEGGNWSWVSQNVSLLPCRHRFCRQCWQFYLCHYIRQGYTTLYCMEYGCRTELDHVTVASLVPPELYTRWQHQCDDQHVTEEGWEWCPRPGCTYLAKKTAPTSAKTRQHGFPVQCLCGASWCYLCKKEPHWPALCHHSNLYHKMLKQKGDDIVLAGNPDSVTYYVKVKRCPACKYPLEKGQGCSHMTCRCGYHFCWECLGSWNEHLMSGLACRFNQKQETTMELDNSLHLSLPICFYNDSVTHRHAWQKMSTYNINKTAATFGAQMKYRQWLRQNHDMPKGGYTEAFIKNTLFFVRDIHQLLERCSVLLSNTTRACRPHTLVACRAQLAFIVSRIEALLTTPRSQQDKMLTRLKSLTYSAQTTVKKLIDLAPRAQSAISAYCEERQQSDMSDT